ncbi:hypothetical protein BC567DRAFT_68773 [Phyllosticta citribraziliensis]
METRGRRRKGKGRDKVPLSALQSVGLRAVGSLRDLLVYTRKRIHLASLPTDQHMYNSTVQYISQVHAHQPAAAAAQSTRPSTSSRWMMHGVVASFGCSAPILHCLVCGMREVHHRVASGVLAPPGLAALLARPCLPPRFVFVFFSFLAFRSAVGSSLLRLLCRRRRPLVDLHLTSLMRQHDTTEQRKRDWTHIAVLCHAISPAFHERILFASRGLFRRYHGGSGSDAQIMWACR